MQPKIALLSWKKSNRSAHGKFLISFDITSLFSSTALEETTNITIDIIFKSYSNVKFTRKELQKLFKIATSETHFIFNNEIYDKIDDISKEFSSYSLSS